MSAVSGRRGFEGNAMRKRRVASIWARYHHGGDSWKSSVCLGLSLEPRYWVRRPSRFNGRKRVSRSPLTVLMPE